jgi:hypothetical protein
VRAPTLRSVTEYVDPDPAVEPDLETVAPLAPGPAPYGTTRGAPAGAEPPTGGRGPVTAFLAAVVVVALIVGFATATLVLDARDSDTNGTAAGPGPTVPNVGPFVPNVPGTTTPRGPADPDEGVLGGLIVKQTDVPAAYTVHHLVHGADLTIGTLNICNGTFATESERTARRQVALTDTEGGQIFGTEAILYRSAAVGTRAVEEIKSVTSRCPSTPVVSPIGDPTATFRFNKPPDAAWPRKASVERLAYDMDAVAAGDPQPSRSIVVYLRRGRVLMGLYFNKPAGTQVPVQGRDTIAGIVGVFQDRMAKLPARVVNG